MQALTHVAMVVKWFSCINAMLVDWILGLIDNRDNDHILVYVKGDVMKSVLTHQEQPAEGINWITSSGK